jgi:hypothetical protein
LLALPAKDRCRSKWQEKSSAFAAMCFLLASWSRKKLAAIWVRKSGPPIVIA